MQLNRRTFMTGGGGGRTRETKQNVGEFWEKLLELRTKRREAIKLAGFLALVFKGVGCSNPDILNHNMEYKEVEDAVAVLSKHYTECRIAWNGDEYKNKFDEQWNIIVNRYKQAVGNVGKATGTGDLRLIHIREGKFDNLSQPVTPDNRLPDSFLEAIAHLDDNVRSYRKKSNPSVFGTDTVDRELNLKLRERILKQYFARRVLTVIEDNQRQGNIEQGAITAIKQELLSVQGEETLDAFVKKVSGLKGYDKISKDI